MTFILLRICFRRHSEKKMCVNWIWWIRMRNYRNDCVDLVHVEQRQTVRVCSRPSEKAAKKIWKQCEKETIKLSKMAYVLRFFLYIHLLNDLMCSSSVRWKRSLNWTHIEYQIYCILVLRSAVLSFIWFFSLLRFAYNQNRFNLLHVGAYVIYR